eukprot:10992133-Karenia_brevis.AAC.1
MMQIMAPNEGVLPMSNLEVAVAAATGIVSDPGRFYAAVGQAVVSAADAPQEMQDARSRISTTPTDERTTYDVSGNQIAAPMSAGSTVVEENVDRSNVLTKGGRTASSVGPSAAANLSD